MCLHEVKKSQPTAIERLYRSIAIVSSVRRALEHDYGSIKLPPHIYDYVQSLEEAEEIFLDNIEAAETFKNERGEA